MKISACDECRNTTAAEWLKIGVLKVVRDQSAMGLGSYVNQLTLGVVPEKEMPGYEVHDICSQNCFHKHIDRLLGRVSSDPAKEVSEEIPTEEKAIEAYTGI